MTVSPLHRENIFQQWHGHFYFCSHETQSRSQMPLRLPHLLTAQPTVNRGRPCKPSAAAHCSTHATHFPSWKFRNPIITIAKVGADEWQPGSPSPCQTTLTPEQSPGKHTIPSRWLHLHLLAWAVEEFHFWLLTYIKWYGLLCPFCDSVILFVWIFLVLWVVFFFGGGRYWLFLFPLYLIYFKVASTVHALLAPSSIYLAFSYLRPKLFHLVYILQSSTLQTELLQQYYVNQIHMLNKTVTHCNVYLSIIIQLPASIPHLPCE